MKQKINLDDYVILEPPRGASHSYAPLLVPFNTTHFNEDWNTAHASLRAEGAHMLTIRQFADLLKLLRSGDAYDGNGNKMQTARITEHYENTRLLPWSGEWLVLNLAKRRLERF